MAVPEDLLEMQRHQERRRIRKINYGPVVVVQVK